MKRNCLRKGAPKAQKEETHSSTPSRASAPLPQAPGAVGQTKTGLNHKSNICSTGCKKSGKAVAEGGKG